MRAFFFNVFQVVEVLQLFHEQQPDIVVDSRASSISSCVVDMVLLFTSKNKSAIKTILLEFITTSFWQNTLFLYYMRHLP